ncbi:MAG: hypothetical protein K4445_10650 [Deltaproteobacteria bacterium]|jgi:phenylacetate-coenzyme A ligase PaaK-like adenylate-forming protein|nr:phenylacetate--CoA ligase family protein [Syntrophaceae bacterium]
MNIAYAFKKSQDLCRSSLKLIGLKLHERWTPERLQDYQRRRLRALFAHAVRRSPFYRELYQNIKIGPEVQLQELPVITKAMMMDAFDRFVTDTRLKLADLQTHIRDLSCDTYYLGEYRVLTTSGSSGFKGVFVFNRKEWSTLIAGYSRCSLSTGKLPRFPRRLRECSIFTDNPAHLSCRIKISSGTPLVLSKHLNAASSIAFLVAELNAFQPHVLSTYPSMASLLAVEQIEGRLKIHLELVATGGETCTGEMTASIQKAWGIIPFNVYASTEGGAFNIGCPFHRGIHAAEDLTILEVVDRNNRPVPAGRAGSKVLLTNLFNYTQPLIRYEISDMLTLSEERCPCGRPFRLIAGVEGRYDDILYFPDSRGHSVPVHPVHFITALGIIPDIKESRVIHEQDGLVIDVVLRDTGDKTKVVDAIKTNLAASLKIQGIELPETRVLFTDHIERNPETMGKFKLVESGMKKPATGAPP